MLLPKNFDITPFKTQIDFIFAYNLVGALRGSLSSLLALDYAGKPEPKILVSEHVTACTKKLKNFIGAKIITDDSFAAAMFLFTIAISPHDIYQEDITSSLKQQQTNNLPINFLLDTELESLNEDKLETVKSALQEILNEHPQHHTVNFLASEKKLVKSIALAAFAKTLEEEQAKIAIKNDLSKILTNQYQIDNKISNSTKIASVLGTAITGITAIAASATILGPALPFAFIPTVIAAIKFGPQLGEKLGEVITKTDDELQNQQGIIDKIKTQLKELAPKLSLEQNIIKQKQTEIASTLSKSDQKILDTAKEKILSNTTQTSQLTTEPKSFKLKENNGRAR